jgi:uncharacterized protein YndB with AHSA1/START domain
MARNTIQIDLPIQQVFDELLIPENFGEWVVGAKRIRGTSGNWPSEGAKFHHTVGVGPVKIADTTEIEEMKRPGRLVLDARAWPLGDARVDLTLIPTTDGSTQLVMVEEVVGGPAKLIPNAVNEPMIHLRNRRSLKRLRRLIMRQRG